MFWYIGNWYFLFPLLSSWITYFHSWQKEAYIYYSVHMYLHVQCLWNDTGLLPQGQIMCSLRNNYQLECYKMGQQFYSAHTVWYFGHQTQQSFFGSLHINQKITLICSDAICGHAWRVQISRSKLESTHSAWTAGPHKGTPDTNMIWGPQSGLGGEGCSKKELLATICK